MPKMPTKVPLPPRLPWEEAFRISDLARVPPSERELFRDCTCGLVEEIWWRDQEAAPVRPGPALMKAAKAARMLHESQLRLDNQDRDWLIRILEREPAVFRRQFERLPQTMWQLDFIFSTATGTPMRSDNERPSSNRGRKQGSVNNRVFQKLVRDLLLAAFAAEGELTLDKNFKKGTLIDALEILREYLPTGLVPNVLPLGTIQKIKTRFNESPH
jgi:hypothetical protein